MGLRKAGKALSLSEEPCGVCVLLVTIPSLPLRRRIQKRDTQDAPVCLFLKRFIKSSPFFLQVKNEICGLQLRADVKTQILTGVWVVDWEVTIYHSFLSSVFLCGY